MTLADSNAILVYLARRHDPQGRWLPEEAVAAAQVQRWLSVAAGPLAEGPGRARVDVLFRRPRDAQAHATARRVFGWMEARLAAQPFLAASGPTIADVALYTYTAHAPEGGVMLEPYPAIGAWLGRVEALPGFVGMRRLPAAPPLAG